MNINFRIGPVRIEVAPKPKVVLDVRKTLASVKQPKKTKKG